METHLLSLTSEYPRIKDSHFPHLLHCLSFYCAFYSFCMSCVHIPGADNGVADALSWDNTTSVSFLLPQALLEHAGDP